MREEHLAMIKRAGGVGYKPCLMNCIGAFKRARTTAKWQEQKHMSITDKVQRITSVNAMCVPRLALTWSDGPPAELDLGEILQSRQFASLLDPAAFALAELGEWGQSVTWPNGAELGAETLWLETLSATGHHDARTFLEWRLRHGLSLSKAAEALGLSRRMVAYYANGEKPVPKSILLACRGWEASQAA